MENLLKRAYYDPTSSGSYYGLNKFSSSLPSSKRKAVKDWLLHQDAYTLHTTPRRRFPRRKTIVAGIDDQWQADLADVSGLKKHNKGYTYLLTVIDVFSKMAWVFPLKNKSGTEVSRAFKAVLQKAFPRIPGRCKLIKAPNLGT